MNTPPKFSVVTDPSSPTGEVLAVDGVVDNGSTIQSERTSRCLKVRDPKTAERILDMRTCEVHSSFDVVVIPLRDVEPIAHAYIDWQSPTNDPGPAIYFGIPLELRNWNHPWTPFEFIDALKSVLSGHKRVDITVRDRGFPGNQPGILKFKLCATDELIRDVVQRHIPTALMLLREATIRLQRRLERKVTLEFGHLPQSVSCSVQQYLLYLYQFLTDLGLDVTSELSCQAGRILFTLVPVSKTQALQRLNKALQLYLQLHSMSEFSSLSRDTSNRALLDLRTPVTVMSEGISALEHRVEVIETEPCRYTINAHPFDPEPIKEDREALVRDLIYVRPFEKFGVKLQIPQMVRALKRRLRRLGRDRQ